METQEKLPCPCGEGAMEVKSTVYGTWKVDELLAACNACGSDDIQSARKVQPRSDEKK